MSRSNKKEFVGTYVDLFSGCGGLSLGLGYAGWKGVFAVEKDEMAFNTFKTNMIDRNAPYAHFDWPDWLPIKATTIQTLLKKYPDQLEKLKGTVDLIAGGPPCQGFSLAGMRNSKDPRNKMSHEYIKMVDLVRPKYLILENVRGFNAVFKDALGKAKKIPYSEVVASKLEALGYHIYKDYVHCEKFGVAQKRTRFIMIGVQRDLVVEGYDPFVELNQMSAGFKKSKGLPVGEVSVKDAISDLELTRRGAKLVHHSGSEQSGFKKLAYREPKTLTPYQALMREGCNGNSPNSMRIARHRETTIEQFKFIQSICRPGLGLTDSERALVGTKKQVISVLDPNKPSKTLTTLPDDVLHYKEPRILTVRESARIQSFPDGYFFTGKYTTGGSRRTMECPRYTQVGNAVPPLLGEVLGQLIAHFSGSI